MGYLWVFRLGPLGPNSDDLHSYIAGNTSAEDLGNISSVVYLILRDWIYESQTELITRVAMRVRINESSLKSKPSASASFSSIACT
jgi:hypothetical protein